MAKLFFFILLFPTLIIAQNKDSLRAKFTFSLLFSTHRDEIIPQQDTVIIGYAKQKSITSNISCSIYNGLTCGLKIHGVQFKTEFYSSISNITNGYLIGPFLAYQENKSNQFFFATARVSYLLGNFLVTNNIYDQTINRKNTYYLALDLEAGLKLTKNIGIIGGINLSLGYLQKNIYGHNYGTIGLQYSFYKKNKTTRTVFKNTRNL